MFKKAIGYVRDTGLLGGVAGYDFITNEVILLDDEQVKVNVKFEDVEILQEALVLHGLTIFNKDVLGAINGKLYLVELHEDGKIQLHNIDEKLETIASGEKVEVNDEVVEQLERIMDLKANYYELLADIPQLPEFNIKIVKHYDGQHYTYYYACNNKEVEQIDLIKVLYFGHQILEEEDYERNTISHEDFLSRMEDGNLKEVSPQELHNFVLGASYRDKPQPQQVESCCEVEDEEDEELVEGVCDECGRDEETDCDCTLW